MTRREFLTMVARSSVAFTILPGAGRLWRAERLRPTGRNFRIAAGPMSFHFDNGFSQKVIELILSPKTPTAEAMAAIRHYNAVEFNRPVFEEGCIWTTRPPTFKILPLPEMVEVMREYRTGGRQWRFGP